MRVLRSVSICLLISAVLPLGQMLRAQSSDPGFKVAPPKDDVMAGDKNSSKPVAPTSQANNPNRTVGPQQDGSIVASDNQLLTQADRIVE